MKVIKIYKDIEKLIFDNGWELYSDHEDECCEIHYLGFHDLEQSDFDGLEFDLNGDFFERIKGYGIALKPLNGHPVRIPGYGYNNGYYTDNLALVLKKSTGEVIQFDITDCQTIEDN